MFILNNELFAIIILIYIILALFLRGSMKDLPVWSIMLFASALTIIFGLLPVDEIYSAIDFDVIFFLIGMFSLVATADHSGAIKYITLTVLNKTKRSWTNLFVLSVTFGLLSAITTNDTIALIGPIIIIIEERTLKTDAKPLFFLLIASITIGSVMSPIGNPQNMLISSESGLNTPFLYFMLFLTIPTIINLLLVTILIIKLFKIKNHEIEIQEISNNLISNKKNAIISIVFIVLTILTFIINDARSVLGYSHIVHIGLIPFLYASIMFLFTSSRREILLKVDWGTIMFFLGMFITMEGIWRSHLFQKILNNIFLDLHKEYDIIIVVSLVSIIFSQFLSNVPMVKLYMNYLLSQGVSGDNVVVWITLAMASTIAGNLTIFGAASNVIVIEIMEARYQRTISYREFFKVGVIITFTSFLVYVIFIYITAILLEL